MYSYRDCCNFNIHFTPPPTCAIEVDLSQKPLNTPTLDYLYGIGAVTSESSYTLTETQSSSDDNIITKYKIEESSDSIEYTDENGTVQTLEYTTKEAVPVYYDVNLKQTTYGTGSNTKYFEWTKDTDGNYIFSEVTEPTNGETTITVNYDNSNATSTRQTSFTSGADVKQSFIGAYTTSSNGGAIYNNSSNSVIGNIIGNFIGNYVSRSSSSANGGAIYNTQTIGNITGDFIGNYTSTSGTYAYGGAIANTGTIGDITGNFIVNYASTTGTSYAYGGAIANSGTIGNITGDFIGNYASTSGTYIYGGAIFNIGTINNITGDFIGNYASSTGTNSQSGAIFNRGTIGDITGNFIGNYTSTIGSFSAGGAISNTSSSNNNAEIGNITGDFIGNYSISTGTYAHGAAIINYYATIKNITGDFIGNYASTSGTYAESGAIGNYASTISNITGDFIGNYASTSGTWVQGGAISNLTNSQIGNITGYFIDNYVSSTGTSLAAGGAISNDNSTIGNITGDYIGNYASTSGTFAEGGAIDNYYGTIGDITGDFIGNYASSSGSYAQGGAIDNYYGTIGDITGDFIGNYASSSGSYAEGGAIDNYYGTIGDITGDFIGNYVSSSESYAYGGAIANTDTINGDITGNFIGNSAESYSGNAQGGAIYNTNSITLKNTNFIDNTASSTNAAAQGGAIYNSGTVNIIAADSSAVVIKDNSVSGGTTEVGGAIYNEASGTVNIQAEDNDSTITFGTSGQSTDDYTDSIHNLGILNFSGSGNVNLYSQICGSTGSVYIEGVNVIASAITQSLLTVNSGSLTINMDNLNISSTLTNNSDLYLTGGTLARTISGTGITYVGDSDGSTSETLTFANGAAILGTLDLNDNTIAFDDSDYDETGSLTTVEIGTLTGSGDMSINVDMSSDTPISDKLTVGSTYSASLNLTGINVLADVTTGSYPDTQTVTYVDGEGAENINYDIYEEPAIVYGDWTTYTNQYQYTFTLGDPGTLTVSSKATAYTLKNYIENGEANSNFSMTDNMYAVNTNEPALGSTAENGNSNDFLVYMNGYTITGDEQSSDGFYVGSNTTEGQTLTLTGSGTITDFNTAITVYSGNTLNLSNIILTENIVDLDNDGTTVLTGTNEIDTVTGEGNTTISSGTTTINNSLEQDTLTVNSGAELDNKGETKVTDLTNSGLTVNDGTITTETIDNSGTINNETSAVLTLNAKENTNLGGKIVNEGTLNLSGENGTTITASAEISGDGTTYINSGSVVNEGTIANDLDISDDADLTTNALNVSGNISNDGTLYYTGGTNSNTIMGNGTLNITADVTNNASVTQDTLIVDEDTTLTNTSSITADNVANSGTIANDGTLTLGSGTTAEITGSGDLTVTGDLSSTGVITQDNLTTNSDSELIINAGNLDIQTSIINNGTLSLTGGTTSLSTGITGSDGIVNLSGVTINLADTVTLDGTYNVRSESTLNMANGVIQSQVIDTLNLSDNLNWTIDVDLTSLTADNLSIGSFSSDGSVINISNILGLTDIKSGAASINILSSNVDTSYVNIENPTYSTPIANYLLSYSGSNGNLNITRQSFNPAILASSVSAQVGAYSAQMAAFDYAFEHIESFMPLPSAERFALRNANMYAITETRGLSASPDDFQNSSMWVRPYTNFESIPLKNGPDVDTVSYGTLVGGDSGLIELKNGWTTAFTGYAGYNGSSQAYSGINTYQNGGLLGATQTFYKNNFFTALTASIGASTGESHNQYGHENFTTLMSGIASKTGYNLEFDEGKFIIQPSMLLSYSFINTFDYTNAAGVRLDSDPLHAIQLHPAIRWYSNLENGWQPYASVGMVWNILDETKVTANDVRLPSMSIKPYVEYGLGVQKRFKDTFTAFGQAMVRNGGRNGIAFTFGLRWNLGKNTTQYPIEHL